METNQTTNKLETLKLEFLNIYGGCDFDNVIEVTENSKIAWIIKTSDQELGVIIRFRDMYIRVTGDKDKRYGGKAKFHLDDAFLSMDDDTNEVWEWPHVQQLMDNPGFKDNSELINGEFQIEIYGNNAYTVSKEWLNNLRYSEIKKYVTNILSNVGFSDEPDMEYEDTIAYDKVPDSEVRGLHIKLDVIHDKLSIYTVRPLDTEDSDQLCYFVANSIMNRIPICRVFKVMDSFTKIDGPNIDQLKDTEKVMIQVESFLHMATTSSEMKSKLLMLISMVVDANDMYDDLYRHITMMNYTSESDRHSKNTYPKPTKKLLS